MSSKKIIFIIAFFTLLLIGAACGLGGCKGGDGSSSGGGDGFQPVGEAPTTQNVTVTLEVTPLKITAGVPTSVFAEVFTADLQPLPTTVTLQRVDEDGNIKETVGTLHDDGQNGDRVANDRRYSLEATLNEPIEGTIRLRTSVSSNEEIILVLPTVTDTSPEEFLRDAAAAFASAQTVDDVLPFIDASLIQAIQRFPDTGLPLSELGDVLASARLSWKTEDAAEFSTTITVGPNQVVRGTVVIRKGTEGWRIVSL